MTHPSPTRWNEAAALISRDSRCFSRGEGSGLAGAPPFQQLDGGHGLPGDPMWDGGCLPPGSPQGTSPGSRHQVKTPESDFSRPEPLNEMRIRKGMLFRGHGRCWRRAWALQGLDTGVLAPSE